MNHALDIGGFQIGPQCQDGGVQYNGLPLRSGAAPEEGFAESGDPVDLDDDIRQLSGSDSRKNPSACFHDFRVDGRCILARQRHEIVFYSDTALGHGARQLLQTTVETPFDSLEKGLRRGLADQVASEASAIAFP